MNRCTGCSRDFTSVTAFDQHRTGSFSKNTRRCMSEQEMRAHKLEYNPASGKWQLVLTAQKKAQIKRLNGKASQNAILAVA